MSNPADIKTAMISVISDRLNERGYGNTPVLYGLPEGKTAAGKEGWIGVYGFSADVDSLSFAHSVDRYEVEWAVTLRIGSGYQSYSEEADRQVVALMLQTAAALDARPDLGIGSEGVIACLLDGFATLEDQSEDEKDRETVVELTYRVSCEGIH